jgi:hypothetical protein
VSLAQGVMRTQEGSWGIAVVMVLLYFITVIWSCVQNHKYIEVILCLSWVKEITPSDSASSTVPKKNNFFQFYFHVFANEILN